MSHYRKGAQIERGVIAFLGKNGYTCIRSAGSKGAYDIIAFNPGELRLIQCKYHGTPRSTPIADKRKTYSLAVPDIASRELWVFTTGSQLVIYTDKETGVFPDEAEVIVLSHEQIQGFYTGI